MPTNENLLAAKEASKKLYGEAFNLIPSAIVTMFEVDVSFLAFDLGYQDDPSQYIFKFHNSIKTMGSSSIYWRGAEYIAAPIFADGFEMSTKGTFPTPNLSISVSPEGIPLLAQFKEISHKFKDFIGGKVTRIRTWAKYLDDINFQFQGQIKPEGFKADRNVEFPRDVFYIEKKAVENKLNITYELSAINDVEGIKLPARLVVGRTCMATYRGEGCMYEYDSRREVDIHGRIGDSLLLQSAPSVATANDESIASIIGNLPIRDLGPHERGKTYQKGDQVYLQKDHIKYYFVYKNDTPSSTAPPNTTYWEADVCSKTVRGCKLRFANQTIGLNVGKGNLPFVGFPGVSRIAQ